MGNTCSNYCNVCGDENTQIKTLDNSQVPHAMQQKNYEQVSQHMHYGQGPPGSPMDDFGRYRNGDNGGLMMAGGGQNMFG